MVKIGATSISNLAVGNKNIDLLNIGNAIFYAGYPYPCVGENDLTPITLQQYIELPYFGDPQNFQVALYFSKYIESFEYRIALAGIDSGFKVCPLNEQVVPGVYGSVTNYGNYAVLLGMCAPRYIANETTAPTVLIRIEFNFFDYESKSIL